MFKSMKSKIVSCLLVFVALTQMGKAEQVPERSVMRQNRQTLVATQGSKGQSKHKSIPIGGIIGLATFGLLGTVGIIRSESYGQDDKYVRNILKKVRENEERRRAFEKPQENSSVVQSPAPAQTTAELAVVPRIQHTENMSSEERAFLATRLHAVRQMEDIKRERSRLTREMAKAKKENNIDKIQEIKSNRRALSVLRKDAFENAVGPVYGQIKEERRLLTKKMTLARRQKDTVLMEEIKQRRAILKQTEQAAKLIVREFKYKQQRAQFIKRKAFNTAALVQQNTMAA